MRDIKQAKAESQRRGLDRYLTKLPGFMTVDSGVQQSASSTSTAEIQNVEEQQTSNVMDIDLSHRSVIQETVCSDSEYESDHVNDESVSECDSVPESSQHNDYDGRSNLDDPFNWPSNIDDSIRCHLVSRGPVQIADFDFPVNENSRKFSKAYYTRIMKNGEKYGRSWLVYSEMNDTVYCFCCRLFNNNIDTGIASESGFNDWRNLSKTLQAHEKTKTHCVNFSAWQEMSIRLKLKQTIDSQQQTLIDEERKRWTSVLVRLCAIIRCIAAQNLAFRGSSCTINTPDNGNFLKIVELFALFDSVMKEHLSKAVSHRKHVHYLGPQIQNELILLMSSKVKAEIISNLHEAKYYSIILDCTPDSSHTEQMSIVVRFVSKRDVKIHEHFLGFVEVNDKTGVGLSSLILKELNDLNIDVQDMRGQSYDNGANMKGNQSGVQRQILNMNPRAFFVPCSSHSLNLVVNDAVKCSVAAVSYFGNVQQLYNFFSASTDRWNRMMQYLPSLTLKRVCDTRWESRIDAVRPIRYQLGELYAALIHISEDASLKGSHGLQTRADAQVLAKCVSDYKFICGTVVWYDILSVVNPVSKQLQSVAFDLQSAVKSVSEVVKFLKEYRHSGFTSMKITASEIASEMEVSANFAEDISVRSRKKTRQFDYESRDLAPVSNPEKRFEVEFFNSVIDAAVISVEERFEQLQNHMSHFDLLSDIGGLADFDSETLLKHCKDLEVNLTDATSSDIDGVELFEELKMVCKLVKAGTGPQDVLQLIYNKRLNEIYPSTVTALRILLTIPVTVASAERSFSKLKLIKNHLRSRMTDERLSALAVLSIEYELAYTLNLHDIVQDFAARKARKIDL